MANKYTILGFAILAIIAIGIVGITLNSQLFVVLFRGGALDDAIVEVNPDSISVSGDLQEIYFEIDYSNLERSYLIAYQFGIYLPLYYAVKKVAPIDNCDIYPENPNLIYCKKWNIDSFNVSFIAIRDNTDPDAKADKEDWVTVVRDNYDNQTTRILTINVGRNDSTAPTVVATYPDADTLDVPVNSLIKVRFSEPMNQHSAESAFSVHPSVLGSFMWKESGEILSFNPEHLDADTTYNVIVSTNAEDLAGNNLEGDYFWSFTTIADTNPPIVGLISPENGLGLVAGDIVFEYAVADETSAVESCSLILDSEEVQSAINIQENEIMSFTQNIQVAGIHLWNISCIDDSPAQNQGIGENDWQFSITIDETPPSWLDYGPKGIIDNSKPTIWAVVRDEESGINLETLKLQIDTTTIDNPNKNTSDHFDDVNVYTVITDYLVNGIHGAGVYFADRAGNEYCTSEGDCTNAGWFYWSFDVQAGGWNGNQPPETTLIASNTTGTAPLTVTFEFTCEDYEGAISSCIIDFGDGSELGFGSEGGIISDSISHVYSNEGIFTATLNATDYEGDSDLTPASVEIDVSQEGLISVSLSASPTTGYAPLTVQFDAAASGGFPPYTYKWDFEDTGVFEIGGISETYTYEYEGEYLATVVVEDMEGNTAFDLVTVTVEEKPNQPPEITGLAAEPPAVNEGAAITFTVDAYDADGDILDYYWEFGDGEVASGQEIKHSYYLEPAEPEREFTATVRVSDGELTASGSIAVKVQKAYFVIKLLEPVSTPTNLLDKDEEVTIRLKIIDSRSSPLTGLSPRASIGDIEIPLSESSSKPGNYAGQFSPSYSTKSVDYLFVETYASVAGESRYASSEFPLYFAPTGIKLSNPFEGREYYIWDTIGKVELGLTYPDSTPVADADIKAFLLYGENRKEIPFTRSAGGIFEGDINYLIREETLISLEISAEDEFGNKTPAAKRFAVPISLENPLFNINLVNPNLEVENIFGYGQPIDFLVAVESAKRGDLRGVEVKLQNDELNLSEKFGFNPETGSHFLRYLLPEKDEYPRNRISFDIVATGVINEKECLDLKKIDLALTDRIDVNFVYPAAGTGFVNLDEPDRIIVRITYPNGDLIDANSVEATLVDNDSNSLITLVRTERGFEANLGYDLRAGEHTFELRLEEEKYRGETTKIVTVLVNPVDIGQIIMFIVALFIAFLIIFFGYSRLREKAKMAEELETERKNLIGLAKSLRYEYYKRHISEQEYKERLLKSQQKLATVEEMLGVRKRTAKIKVPKAQKQKLMKEIKSKTREKSKTVEKPVKGKKEKGGIKDYFKAAPDKLSGKPIDKELGQQFSGAEREDIKRLVFLLRNQKAKYSRKEIFKTVVADGYPPKIAEKVVEILFRK